MRTVLLAVILAFVAGCASSNVRIDAAGLAGLRKGQSTYDETIRRFGTPNFLSRNWDGSRTAAYAYSEGRSDAAMTLPALGAALSGAGSSMDSVVLQFDAKGVLTDYRSSQAGAQTSGPPAAAPDPASPAGPTATAVRPDRAAADPTAPAAASKAQRAPSTPSAGPASRRDDGLPWWLPPEARDAHR